MQSVVFIALIFSNLLSIQGETDKDKLKSPNIGIDGERDKDILSYPYRGLDDFESVSKLYAKYRTGNSSCKTKECQVDELIKKFSNESEPETNNPPTKLPTRPSFFGSLVHWLFKMKQNMTKT